MKTKFYEADHQLKELMFKKFVHNDPCFLDEAICREFPYELKELASAMDYFEFHYRHYIAGMHQTLHRVLSEIRRLKSLKYFEMNTATIIIDLIEQDILDYELYELMPRYLKAKKRVIKEIQIQKILKP